MGELATTAPAFALDVEAVLAKAWVDVAESLDESAVAAERARVGTNEIPRERPPSGWKVAVAQLRDPMNLMLVGVVVVSLVIGQGATALLVALLVVLNMFLGARQNLKARASVEALADLQVPQARVVRGGRTLLVPGADLVPGDVFQVEAGDVAPADGRLVRSATLETQESALTGESAPVAKDPTTLAGDDVALGDRTNLVFQGTAITRRT
jgi:P-type Ca2+ transporter type 2C